MHFTKITHTQNVSNPKLKLTSLHINLLIFHVIIHIYNYIFLTFRSIKFQTIYRKFQRTSNRFNHLTDYCTRLGNSIVFKLRYASLDKIQAADKIFQFVIFNLCQLHLFLIGIYQSNTSIYILIRIIRI